MSTKKRRFSSVIMFTATVLLTMGISGGLYFLQIKKNEDYQNQLHFRELNEVSTSVSSAVTQLTNIAALGQDNQAEVLEVLDYFRRLSTAVDSVYNELSAVNALALEENFVLEEALSNIDYAIEDYLSEPFYDIDEDIIEFISDCDIEPEVCAYFAELEDQLIYGLNLDALYGSSDPATQSKVYSDDVADLLNIAYTSANAGLSSSLQLVNSERDALTSLKHSLGTETNPESIIKLLRGACGSNSAILMCEDIDKWLEDAIRSTKSALSAKMKKSSKESSPSTTDLSAQKAELLIDMDEELEAIEEEISLTVDGLQFLTQISQRTSALIELLNENYAGATTVQDALNSGWAKTYDELYLQEAINTYLRLGGEGESGSGRRDLSSVPDTAKAQWRTMSQEFDQDIAPMLKEDMGVPWCLGTIIEIGLEDSRTCSLPKLDKILPSQLEMLKAFPNGDEWDSLMRMLVQSYQSMQEEKLELIGSGSLGSISQVNGADNDGKPGVLTFDNDGYAYIGVQVSSERFIASSESRSSDKQRKSNPNSAQNVVRETEDIAKLADKYFATTFRASTEDFIPSELQRFPMVLLANPSGEVLARKRYTSQDVTGTDLHFLEVSTLFEKLYDKQVESGSTGKSESSESATINVDVSGSEGEGDKVKAPTFSGMIEVEIGGIRYRAFIQPLSLNSSLSNYDTLFAIGLVPVSQLTLAKLAISPGVALWVVLLLVLLIALIPMLKVRFASTGYAFTGADISQVGIGMLVVAGVLSIALGDQLFYRYFIQEKIEQGQAIHQSIRTDFEKEVRALLTQAMPANDPRGGAATGAAEDYYDAIFTDSQINSEFEYCYATSVNSKFIARGLVTFEDCVSELMSFDVPRRLDGYQTNKKYIIENGTHLDDSGHISLDFPLRYVNDALFFRADFLLDFRTYFKRAIACDVWKPDGVSDCDQGYFIERINNVEDGRKNSQFAFPDFKSLEDDDKTITIFNTRLRTFLDRVLPLNFGYAVFDSDGHVQFHSDDSRSLIENIFIETDRNEQLVALTKLRQHSRAPVALDVPYRGDSHVFVAGPLMQVSDIGNPPWTLAVFYNKQEAAVNNMLLIFLTTILFLFFLVPLFIYQRFVCDQRFWSHLVYYRERFHRRYPGWAFLLAGATVFVWLAMGVFDDLLVRILLWLSVALVLLNVFYRRMYLSHTITSVWRKPHVPVFLYIALIGLLFLSSSPIDMSHLHMNYAFTSCGLAFLLVSAMVSKRHRRQPTPTEKAALIVFALALALMTGLSMREEVWMEEPETVGLYACAFVLVVFAYSLCLPHRDRWTTWWNKRQEAMGRNVDPQVNRYSKGYVTFLLALIVFVGGLPGSLITNSANGYLLQRQAEVQSYALQKRVADYQKSVGEYLSLLRLDSESYDTIDWESDENIQKLFPAYKNWVVKSESTKSNLADDLLDAVLANLSMDSSISATLSYLSMSELENADQNTPIDSNQKYLLAYRPDRFMLSAFTTQWIYILFTVVVMLLIMYKLIELILVRRLLGEQLADHFRAAKPSEHYVSDEKWINLMSKLQSDKPKRIQLLYSDAEEVISHLPEALSLYEQRAISVNECLDLVGSTNVFLAHLRAHLAQHSGNTIVALSGIDEIVLNVRIRLDALSFIEALLIEPRVHVILLSDTAPMYRLTKHEAYSQPSSDAKMDLDEKLRWAKLFSSFEKFYDWTPQRKSVLAEIHSAEDMLDHESNGWRILQKIRGKFEDYHQQVKATGDEKPLSAEVMNALWQPEQVVEFFQAHAGPFYRKQWELCTREEKITLYQMALGSKVNPQNMEVLNHLQRRGYIFRDKGWHIVNESFTRFILNAETEGTFADWLADAESGIWHYMRIPLFTLLLVLVVVIIFSSGQALDSVLGIVTAALGIIPLLLRNISLIRGGGAPAGE